MSFTTITLLLLIGLAIGTVSGMVGIGGGVLVIPVLMFAFKFTQEQANGTSLAMLLPPIGIFAVLAYSKAENINWPYAMLLAVGFAAGAYLGAKLVNSGWIHPRALRFTFALLLVYCAERILFRPGGSARAALETSLLVIGFATTYAVFRLAGRPSKASPNWAAVYRGKRKEPQNFDYEI